MLTSSGTVPMNLETLGRTRLDVSPMCPGNLTYGLPECDPHPWTLRGDGNLPMIRQALDLALDEMSAL